MKIVAGRTLPQIKTQLKNKIDNEAEAIRLNFVTPGSAQAMVYQRKAEEARAFLQNENIDESLIPHIVREATMNGTTKYLTATAILTMETQWAHISAQIEEKRLGAKAAVEAAGSLADARLASQVDWTITI